MRVSDDRLYRRSDCGREAFGDRLWYDLSGIKKCGRFVGAALIYTEQQVMCLVITQLDILAEL